MCLTVPLHFLWKGLWKGSHVSVPRWWVCITCSFVDPGRETVGSGVAAWHQSCTDDRAVKGKARCCASPVWQTQVLQVAHRSNPTGIWSSGCVCITFCFLPVLTDFCFFFFSPLIGQHRLLQPQILKPLAYQFCLLENDVVQSWSCIPSII